MIKIDKERQRLLETNGHILVVGGPGSGKTTIALHKACHDISTGLLKPGQRILFLSFARATISRVIQQADSIISKPEQSLLEICTYHGFAWNLLRSHGYLLKAGSPIRLLPPPEAATRLSAIAEENKESEKRRLFNEEGMLHFDLFAVVTYELLSKSKSLTGIICDTYPIIILDEFQDTDQNEWMMIQALGTKSQLISLADAEQRIYEFRGADPKRIGEFINAYSPAQFNFGTENNRSNGTDIVAFGNDLLAETNKTKSYNDVAVLPYHYYRGLGQHFPLKSALLQGIRRQAKSSAGSWSIAVLVPSKSFMLSVSDYLSSARDRLPEIDHDVALDSEGPALVAVLLAGLLEGDAVIDNILQRLISDLCNFIRGRKGGDASPSQGELGLVVSLDSYLQTGAIRGKNKQQVVDECRRIAEKRQTIRLVGDPGEDWLAVRKLLVESRAKEILRAAETAKYLRLLHKGATLRAKLAELWRTNGSYRGATEAVQNALLQEHFSASFKERKGVQVMTIHKSKGKEFDEVFIYEGSHQGKIVRDNASSKEIAQARLALRVAITRARKRATILTPKNNVCCFLQ